MSFNSDPKVIGPGIWFEIHVIAKDATTDPKKYFFIDHMNLLAEKFPCEKCRLHIRQYIIDHPFSDFLLLTNSKSEPIGMFKWSWMFHNAVNTRLGKPYVDYETACNMFSDPGVMICSSNCSDNTPIGITMKPVDIKYKHNSTR